MNYQIQGLSIHAEEHGTGEPALVFLHYWGGTSRTWRQVTAELEGQFKTVAYDARGWGKSDKTLAGYRLADLADEALSRVKALGIKQCVLVGHSMGARSRSSPHHGGRRGIQTRALRLRQLKAQMLVTESSPQ